MLLQTIKLKKISLASGYRPSENFSLWPAHIVKCISKYRFLTKKNKKAKKAKETKEEKRRSVENLTREDDILYEFAVYF